MQKIITRLSLIAILSINLHAYEVGGGEDNGQISNVSVGFLANSVNTFDTTLGNSAITGGTTAGNTAIGASSYAENRSTALGYNASATGVSSIAIGDYSVTTEDATVSFGTSTFRRRLINVADPINAFDAVNLNYLNSALTNYYTKTQVDTLISSVSGGSVDLSGVYTYIDTKIATVSSSGGVSSSYVDTQDAQTLSSANAYTDAKVQEAKAYTDAKVQEAKAYTDQQVQEAKKEARAGVALALALSTPLDFSNGSNAMNIGTGYFKGQSAVGINFGKKINDYTHYTLGVARNSQDSAVKASVGFSW